MLPRAVTARVAYVPGTAFFADGFGAQIDAAVLLLPHPGADPRGRAPAGGVIEEELELRETFGAGRAAAATPTAQRLRRPRHGPDDDRRTAVSSRRTHRVVGARRRPLPRARRLAALRAAGWPRRCASAGCEVERARRGRRPAARAPRRPRPPAWSRCCTARPARTARSARSSSCSACPTSASRPPPAGSAFDKPVAKAVVARAGHRHARVGVRCRTRRSASSAPAAVMDGAWSPRLGLPLIVKPARGGSALGCTRGARRAPSCPPRWSAPSPTATPRWSSASSTGTEVAVPVVDTATARGRCPRCRSGRTAGSTTTPPATPPAARSSRCPAKLADEVADECARVAVAAHEALGLRDLSRSDLIVDADGHVWFLEVNVAPGLTETSTVPLSVAGRRARPRRGAGRPGPRRGRARRAVRHGERAGRDATSPTRRSSSRPSSASGRSGLRFDDAPAPSTSRAPAARCSRSTTSPTSTSSSAASPRRPVERLVRFMAKRELFDHTVTGPLMRVAAPHRGGPGRRRWRRTTRRCATCAAARWSASSPRRPSRGPSRSRSSRPARPGSRPRPASRWSRWCCGAPSG